MTSARSDTLRPRQPLEQPRQAVFDLDGTLLDGDSTGRWLWAEITASRARLLAGLLLGPLAGLLLALPPFKRWGASVFLWVATFGKNEAALEASILRFVEQVRREQVPLRWRARGLDTLEGHRTAGHRVVIVTGAPELLAARLLDDRYPAPTFDVIGSSLGRVAGGWCAVRHCHGAEKCRYLAEAGYGEAWDFAYTDSAADLPILARAAQPFLVNASGKLARALQRSGLDRLQTVDW